MCNFNDLRKIIYCSPIVFFSSLVEYIVMDPLKIKIIISLDKPDRVCVISSDINMILKPACKIRFSDVSGEILLISLFIKFKIIVI